jgi:NADPH:quinone reductase-like Zn-dependent oxidoreductase
MKAVVFEKYGPPDVLELKNIDKPIPKDNEVLVKIYATTVTAGDCHLRKADHFLIRFIAGLFRPTRVKILGFELAGVVEEAGKEVHSFKKGDAVFASCGLKFGAYAEYKCLPENDTIAIKPSNITFEEAAAIPIGGLTALRFLRQAGVTNGQRILIYGASGSVGTFAVQLGKYFAAHVTGVCSTDNIEMVQSIGADEIIDYRKEDFTKLPATFDLVFDAVGKTTKSACKKILKPQGKFLSVMNMPKKRQGDLLFLKQLAESGRLKTVIDRRYPLDEIREAHTYVDMHHKKGNVIIIVSGTHKD